METATQNGAMTIIRLITNNYLQTLCSLSSSCGETELYIALQNPLPSPTRTPLLSVSLSFYPSFSLPFLRPDLLFIPSVVQFQSLSISSFCSSLSLSLPLSVRGHHCNRSPPPQISCLNPNILFIYVHGTLLSTSLLFLVYLSLKD